MPNKVPSVEVPLEIGDFKVEWGSGFHTPKEMWDFARQGQADHSAEDIARSFLLTNRILFGLAPDLDGLRHQKTLRGLGATHVVFRQFLGPKKQQYPLFRAFVTVHIDNQRQVYMCKCRALPYGWTRRYARISGDRFEVTRREAGAAAKAKILNPTDPKMEGFEMEGQFRRKAKNLTIRKAEQAWWYSNAGMKTAWRVRVANTHPVEEWAFYLSAGDKQNIKIFQVTNTGISHASRKRKTRDQIKKVEAHVFSPNPVTRLPSLDSVIGDQAEFVRKLEGLAEGESGRDLLAPPPDSAYIGVALQGLDDSGKLWGDKVKVMVPKGTPALNYKRKPIDLVRARKPGTKKRTGFEEIMVYYHIDTAIRYLEELGYRGDLAIFKKPLVANVYWTHVDGSLYDGAWYNHPDQQLCFGTGSVSDAEDGETIVHELGHAVQDHICENWGQSNQGQAMGEGFSDYFAMSMFADEKSDRYKKTVLSWDGLLNGFKWNIDPPCQRKIDGHGWYGALVFSNFVDDEAAWVHTNGLIWVATLWDIREALGRDIADRIIIESHFEQSPYTNYSRGARAIIHADRNLNGGKNKAALVAIFKNREIPPYSRKRPKLRNQEFYEFEQEVLRLKKENEMSDRALSNHFNKPRNTVTPYLIRKIRERYKQ